MAPTVVLGTLKLVMTSFDLGGRRPTLYSGEPSLSPTDHTCQISTLSDENCGRETVTYTVAWGMSQSARSDIRSTLLSQVVTKCTLPTAAFEPLFQPFGLSWESTIAVGPLFQPFGLSWKQPILLNLDLCSGQLGWAETYKWPRRSWRRRSLKLICQFVMRNMLRLIKLEK